MGNIEWQVGLLLAIFKINLDEWCLSSYNPR